MTTISIRPAKIEDLSILLEFEQGVIKAERPLDPFLKEGKINYYTIESLIIAKNCELLVAVSNDEIIGSGYVRIENSKHYHKNSQNGYIGFIYVKPEFRGQRVSKQILNSLKAWAKKNNLKELRLDVYDTNYAAIKSYERFGFKKSLVNMRLEI